MKNHQPHQGQAQGPPRRTPPPPGRPTLPPLPFHAPLAFPRRPHSPPGPHACPAGPGLLTCHMPCLPQPTTHWPRSTNACLKKQTRRLQRPTHSARRDHARCPPQTALARSPPGQPLARLSRPGWVLLAWHGSIASSPGHTRPLTSQRRPQVGPGPQAQPLPSRPAWSLAAAGSPAHATSWASGVCRARALAKQPQVREPGRRPARLQPTAPRPAFHLGLRASTRRPQPEAPARPACRSSSVGRALD